MRLDRAVTILCAGALLVGGCGREPKATGETETSATSAATREFAVKGVVREVRLAERELVIQHEDIPGYMKAMTMPFTVKNTNELAGIEPGVPVSFRMVVTGDDGWIEDVRKLGTPRSIEPAPVRLARDVEPLAPGDLLPDYPLTNQFGQVIRTASFKGQALAVTFLFTRCPFPTYCPLMTKNFKEAQTRLAGMASGPTNWHLLTVSFDPAFDTPAVLKAYAESQGYDPRHWTFATGSLLEVTAMTEQFGLVFWREQSGTLSHNLRTAVIDASGRVRRVFEGNKWASEELVAELVDAAKAQN